MEKDRYKMDGIVRATALLNDVARALALLSDYGLRVAEWQASSRQGGMIRMESMEAAECARRLLLPGRVLSTV